MWKCSLIIIILITNNKNIHALDDTEWRSPLTLSGTSPLTLSGDSPWLWVKIPPWQESYGGFSLTWKIKETCLGAPEENFRNVPSIMVKALSLYTSNSSCYKNCCHNNSTNTYLGNFDGLVKTTVKGQTCWKSQPYTRTCGRSRGSGHYCPAQ